MPTTPTQIRLTEADRLNVEAVRRYHGLTTAASAIRFALNLAARQIAPAPPKRPRRSP